MRAHAAEAARILKEHNFDEVTKKALIEYFQFTANKYYQLRNSVALAIIIVALGCLAGIWVVHHQNNKICASSKNNKEVLTQLVDRSGSSQFDPTKIKNDPALKAILIQSNKNGQAFKAFAHEILNQRSCN